MKTLYLECYSGISGDMTVAALLDLGADEQVLRHALTSLPVKGFDIKISRVKKSGLDVCDFDVLLDEDHENHDHDMSYLHGDDHVEHVHNHGQHAHGEHMHSHTHRGMKEIREILTQADLTPRAYETAIRIFTVLGEAEAKAHGTTLEQVHFHEVGAVDSIVDIVSVAVCLDNLNIDDVIVPVLYEGGGTIHCQHGILPVPVPAVSNIVAAHGIRLALTGENGEYVTPTGAAIVAAVRTSDKLPESFVMERIGLGGGKREYKRPGILRAILIREEEKEQEKEKIWKLESNIDDCTGENLGYVLDRLMEAGARDVHYSAVYMKKNRPAWQLNVICTEERIPMLEQIIFEETTTIGIRKNRVERSVLKRTFDTVRISEGEAKVKLCQVPGRDGIKSIQRCYPEYESVVQLCRASGKSYQEIYQEIVAVWYEKNRWSMKSVNRHDLGGIDRMSGKIYSHIDKIPSGSASRKVTEGCLVLEGGAFRGLYSQGFMDAMMKAGINMQCTIGVSAGAMAGMNYVAGQIGRSARVNLRYRHDSRYVGIQAVRHKKGLIGFDFVFDGLKESDPFDGKRFFEPERRFVAVATNCLTGETEYFEKGHCTNIFHAIRASASMPYISKMVDIDGKPYLDGGCSCKIPYQWAIDQGFEKIVVIKTRHADYRKNLKKASETSLAHRIYHTYPEFAHVLEQSDAAYNHQCDELEQLAKAGRIYLVSLSVPMRISRLEKDMEKLGHLYARGYKDAKDQMEQLKAYLGMK